MFDIKLHCCSPLRYSFRSCVFISGLLLMPGCTTYGTVHVGQPQIHTRDRLVAERHDEAAWLKTKLKPENLATVGNQVDGYRDLRVFTGVFARIDANLDPEAEKRKEIETNTAEAEAEAAFWAAKAKAKTAKDAFENPTEDTSKEEPVTPPAVSGTTTTTDVTTTEFLRNSENELVLDESGNPVQTKVITVNEDVRAAVPDSSKDSGIEAQIAEAAKTAAAEAVAAVKETADSALAKANEANTKLDDAITAATTSRFTQANGNGALSAPDPEKSIVTPSPLNKLHDQMAYRDVVNAALREVELDDAHDLGGTQLYEFTLDATVIPGEKSTQYAQLELILEPSSVVNNRIKQMGDLFDRWADTLQATLHEETYELLQRNESNKLTNDDERFIDWFLFSHAHVVKIGLERRKTALTKISNKIDSQLSLTDADFEDAYTGGDIFVPLVLKFGGDPNRAIVDKAMNVISSIDIEAINDILKLDKGTDNSPQRKEARTKAIAWAVWAKYRNELLDIVEITQPVVGDDGVISSGMRVTKLPGYVVNKKKDEKLSNGCTALEQGDPNLSKFESLFPNTKNTGLCVFTRRVMRAEDHPIAISVSPKESAQNISEVAARERMLELILNLKASTAEGSGAVNTQFLNRRREQVHALTRKPQVIGYGQGRERFGWLLGPRFKVTESGEPEWLHEAVRHDVSAAVVVPGWWRHMHINGIYSWIDDDGTQILHKCIWGGELKVVDGKRHCERKGDQKPYVSVSLPMSAEPMADLTRALVSSGGARNRYSIFADRRPPVIDKVMAGVERVPPSDNDASSSSKEQLVTAGGKVSLLIQGHDLWRSPQIFLGSVEASTIKVLSDMDALLATFDALPYPGTPEQKKANKEVKQMVTVLTAFGSDQSDLVYVLPQLSKATPPKPKPGGSLTTRLWAGSNPVFEFKIPKVEQIAGVIKLRIREKGGENWTDPGSYSFTLAGDKATFKLTRAAETKVLEVDVIRLANNTTEIGKGVSFLDGPATLVLLKTEGLEKGRLSPLALGFEKNGTYAGMELAVSFDMKNASDPLFKALSSHYIGWDASFPEGKIGKAKLALYENISNNVSITLPVKCHSSDQKRACAIGKTELETAFKDKLPRLAGKTFKLELILDGNKGSSIKVTKPLKITQKK